MGEQISPKMIEVENHGGGQAATAVGSHADIALSRRPSSDICQRLMVGVRDTWRWRCGSPEVAADKVRAMYHGQAITR